ncbi:peptide-methionine (S)-S-oxide reductase [Staphylococcus aureus]|uniref:peptide-methionine (S)-S-oxide reductase n=1 Tax=Staphylococcus aureus TaxID=1280 RepID=UPI0002E18609|nr:peptide-methionine (S)-S-oxide reductase [Staphylococcus aureus]AZB47985.1 peptide-methionine (S)-S-oxide reductase [Staphylococcus aureus]EKV4461559.1 peptide-methionine (S)-S-oxide reductase [Staphylococcus aureus]MDL2064992.1 peptide-methionine (S)-S-oxide reductase [Staphylococcus aureus]MDL2070054.1 peptide-methionine (S)-S-oxide reductase [Staphylococcus aureus]OZG82878.1 methionine sulfoxide reductase A [Staphylococcus aureus]
MAVVYVAGGCLWGVEAFFTTIPGIIHTEAGRANGRSFKLDSPYDGYAECVKLHFDDRMLTITDIMNYLFEIIDPYSVNRQGNDIGEKYRTGLYSCVDDHLIEARQFIERRKDRDKIAVEVLPLSNYIKSAEEHQQHLEKYPEDMHMCHISIDLLNKYK